MYFADLSPLAQILYRVEKFSRNNIDTLWIVFGISTFFFIVLILWSILATIRRKEDMIVISESKISQFKSISSTDPFAKTDVNVFSDDMGYKLISTEEEKFSATGNYLINSSGGNKDLDLLQSEIDIYEDSFARERDNVMLNEESSAFQLSSDNGDFDYSSELEKPLELTSSFEQKDEDLSGYSIKEKKLNIPVFEQMPHIPSVENFSRKQIKKIDLKIPEKTLGFPSIEDFSKKERPRESLKIELPKKDMVLTKSNENSLSSAFPELHGDSGVPLKAMKIELPQKGKIDGKKDGTGDRIKLPQKKAK